MKKSEKPEQDVIVIGAGISGLAAAYELTNMGSPVLLVEARSRVGGQLHSVSVHKKKMDLGAMYVHGDSAGSNPLAPLLKRYEIETSPVDIYQSETFDTKGQRVDLKEVYENCQGAISEEIIKIQEAKSMHYHHHTPPTVADVLGEITPPPTADSKPFWTRKLITASIKHHTGAELNELSLLDLMFEEPYTGENELVLGGYQKLAEGLYQDAMDTGRLTPQLNTIVTRIHHDPNDPMITVITQDGQEFQGKTVICALPLNVLKHGKISFRPELSPEKRQAMHHVKMGNQNKVYLEFEKAFWPENVQYLYPNDPKMEYWPEYLNLSPHLKKPALLACFYGNEALFGEMSSEQILQRTLKPLQRAYPKANIALNQSKISHWDSDPFSLGSGTYCSFGCEEKHIDALNENEKGGLIFANGFKQIKQGQQATVEGAFEAGVQAALEAEAYLKFKTRETLEKEKVKKQVKRRREKEDKREEEKEWKERSEQERRKTETFQGEMKFPGRPKSPKEIPFPPKKRPKV